MAPLYDDRNLRSISQAAEFLVKHQEMIDQIQRTVESFSNAALLLTSVSQASNVLNILSPVIQHSLLAEQWSTWFSNNLVGPDTEQLHIDFDQEPDEHEVLEHPETELLLPETRKRIITYSPSQLLLEQIRAQKISLHDIRWREFEEIVAELLRQDGYTVELGRGTKDGGKDIVAIKEVLGVGLVMSVWQAKKPLAGNKVDIHVIRELADTRIQTGASKGVIVTTTSLTKDALKRIEQDRYLLHKVDGVDMDAWIQRNRIV